MPSNKVNAALSSAPASPDSRRLARLLFWAAAAFAFVMAVLPHPPQVPGAPNDKIQHIIAFVTLAALGAWAFRGDSLLRLAIGLSLFGALIEVVQAIPALHRDSDVFDWLADTAAATALLLAVRWWQTRRNGTQSTQGE